MCKYINISTWNNNIRKYTNRWVTYPHTHQYIILLIQKYTKTHTFTYLYIYLYIMMYYFFNSYVIINLIIYRNNLYIYSI